MRAQVRQHHPGTAVLADVEHRGELAVCRARDDDGFGLEVEHEEIAGLGNVRVIVASSSLKSCLVARGLADLYPAFGPTSEWDTAAGQCLLEAAGGAMTDLALRPLSYNRSDSLENPSFIAFGDRRVDWRNMLAELNA